MRAGFSLVLVAGVVAGFAADATACVCERAPLEERLDRAEAAIIGRVVANRGVTIRGARQTLLTIEVDQRVKGDVEDTLVVRSPAMTDCDLDVPRDEQVGLLLTRTPGGDWLGTVCSVVDPGQLVAEGGEPRGGPIKVVIGAGVLAIVLFWAFRRLRRGARPNLPGAPEP